MQRALTACRPVTPEWGPTKYNLVTLGFKGSERGSKLGPVANNCENIATLRQCLGMQSWNFRPCGSNGPRECFGTGGLSMAY